MYALQTTALLGEIKFLDGSILYVARAVKFAITGTHTADALELWTGYDYGVGTRAMHTRALDWFWLQ